jgi:hypothetical protein
MTLSLAPIQPSRTHSFIKRCLARLHLRFACWTSMGIPRLPFIQRLYYRYALVAIETICAHPMRWFGVASVWFQHVSQRALPDSLKFITLLLSFPCFEVSHFFFKLAYAMQQRRLCFACGEDLFLKFYNRAVPSGSVTQILYGLRQIESSLKRVKTPDDLRSCDHAVPRSISFSSCAGRLERLLPSEGMNSTSPVLASGGGTEANPILDVEVGGMRLRPGQQVVLSIAGRELSVQQKYLGHHQRDPA